MKEKRVQMKICFRKNLLFFWGMLMFLGVADIAQASQNPALRFQEVAGSNGAIVRDVVNRLEWQRCPYGQSWTGSGCSGVAWGGSWHDAIEVRAPDGFRLPTIAQLITLDPYDRTIFPGDACFWSSSTYKGSDDYAWNLSLRYGSSNYNGKNDYDGYQIRLVRGGQ